MRDFWKIAIILVALVFIAPSMQQASSIFITTAILMIVVKVFLSSPTHIEQGLDKRKDEVRSKIPTNSLI